MNIFGKEITGKQFNEIHGNIPMYKFTNWEETHYGYVYTDGLNVDIKKFDISNGDCSTGGLYFTSVKHIGHWIARNKFVRTVTIPNDARVCAYETKFKSNKIILGTRCYIFNSNIFENIETQILAVQQDPHVIRYIKSPSEEIKILAVKQNGLAIIHIKEPSEEVKIMAVKQNGLVLQYIDLPSEEIKILAVSTNANAIRYIELLNEEIKILAVKQNGLVLRYIDLPSEEVKILAVSNNTYAIQFIDSPSDEIKKIASHKDDSVIILQ